MSLTIIIIQLVKLKEKNIYRCKVYSRRCQKKKKDKKPGSFIAIALICSLLGGAIGGTSTYAIISNINNKKCNK